MRGVNGAVQTKTPGVLFAGDFPQLARLTDRLAVIRSYATGHTDHNRGFMQVNYGRAGEGPSLSSIYSRTAGLTNPATGIPSGVFIPPETFDPSFKTIHSLSRFLGGDYLGSAYAPFDPSSGGEVLDNMRVNVPLERLGDRRSLLEQLDRVDRQIDRTGALAAVDRFQQTAYDVIRSSAADAFDLSKEKPETLARYDTSGFPKGMRDHVQHQALGKQMLLARRLVERGAGFVTVESLGWDMHGGHIGMVPGMKTLGPPLDKAVSAFVEDIHERGLDDKVLLIVSGEMGRTPKIVDNGGRQHWATLAPLLIAGGGLKMGQVIGESDREAAVPVTMPLDNSHLTATIFRLLIDTPQARLRPDLPVQMVNFTGAGAPIPHLM